MTYSDTGGTGPVVLLLHGVPTTRSQRQTWEHDAVELLRLCREDESSTPTAPPGAVQRLRLEWITTGSSDWSGFAVR